MALLIFFPIFFSCMHILHGSSPSHDSHKTWFERGSVFSSGFLFLFFFWWKNLLLNPYEWDIQKSPHNLYKNDPTPHLAAFSLPSWVSHSYIFKRRQNIVECGVLLSTAQVQRNQFYYTFIIKKRSTFHKRLMPHDPSSRWDSPAKLKWLSWKNQS